MRRKGKILMRTIVAALTMAVSASACGFLGLGGTSWKEEVLLHDGSKLIVERHMVRGGRHEIGQKPPAKERSLTFSMPETNRRVDWKSEYSKDVGFADLSPIVLDIVNRTAYLVTEPVGCLAYNKWKRPNPPYVVFRYQNDAWQQIDLKDLPIEIQTPNLIISSPDVKAEQSGKRVIPSGDIFKLNASLTQPEYSSILRKPLAEGARCLQYSSSPKAPIPITPKAPDK